MFQGILAVSYGATMARFLPMLEEWPPDLETFWTPFKESSYSRDPVRISVHVSFFPILALLEIDFMAYRSSHKSNPSTSRFCTFPLCPMQLRKQSL